MASERGCIYAETNVAPGGPRARLLPRIAQSVFGLARQGTSGIRRSAREDGVRLLDASFAVTPRAPAQARHAIDEIGPVVPSDVKEPLRLIASELVANAVQHGPLGQQRSIRLRAEAWRGSIRLEVLDEGEGFSWSTRVPPGTDYHGWGLSIVESLASSWGIEGSDDAGTKVWAELPLSRSVTTPSD
jgi:two-component sensor histidine kinase